MSGVEDPGRDGFMGRMINSRVCAKIWIWKALFTGV